jgi:hypothetical protein
MHLQAEDEAQDRMQLAVMKAVSAGVWGAKQPFTSLLFTDIYEATTQPTGQPFPYDVKFLSAQSLQNLISLSKETHHEIWSADRIVAYQGKDILAKRAAVSPFLWQRYCDYPQMSLEVLELWHRVEGLDHLMTIPSWFRQQHVREPDLLELWKRKVGLAKWIAWKEQHQQLMQELMEKI